MLWAATLDSRTDRQIVGYALAAGAVGGAAGTLIAAYYRPPQGAVEMVRSGGLWGTSTALMLALMASSDNASSHAIFTTLAIGMDAGLATGALLASKFTVSRNRMLLIDAGALAGLGFGLGGTWLIAGSSSNRHAIGAGGLVGLAAGLVIATVATGNMDADDDRSQARNMVPALVARDESGHWGLGSLAVAPVAGPAGSGASVIGATATLLGGTF